MIRYCHECGSEVAKIDVFCSFCGIALPALEETDNDEPISPEKTESLPIETESKGSVELSDDENLLEKNEPEAKNPQDLWMKTDEVVLPNESIVEPEINELLGKPDILPTIEKYADETENNNESDFNTTTDELINPNLPETNDSDKTENKVVAENQIEIDEPFVNQESSNQAEQDEANDRFQSTVSYNLSDVEQLQIDTEIDNEIETNVAFIEEVKFEEEAVSEPIEEEIVTEVVEVEEEIVTEITEEKVSEENDELLLTDDEIEAKLQEIDLIKQEVLIEDEIESETENEPEAIVSNDIIENAEESVEPIFENTEPNIIENEPKVIEDVEETETVIEEDEPVETLDEIESIEETVTEVETEVEPIEALVTETEVEEPITEIEVEPIESVFEETEAVAELEATELEIPEVSDEQNEIIVDDSDDSILENLAPIAIAAPIVAAFAINSVESEKAEESTQTADSQELNPERESRPYTSPINDGVDTGGKSKKLQTLAEGTVLNGRYEIIRKIGGGGMGAVYLASDRNLGGVLRAVKEMVQSYIEEDAQDKAVQDFKRESLLLTSLEHPSIPTIFDYFLDQKEERFYLVMKYISGGDLGSRLRSAPEGKVDEKTITEWAIQISDVLDYLHRHEPPIVYRDLKPSNVMIDGNSGRIMIIDFGIARWVNKEEKGVTAVGTMGYAPPELFSGNVEPRSDIYSLGSTMFHLLTGADPQNNPLLIFDFNKNPKPRQINPQMSDQMEHILMRAVEYNVEGRFSSTAEMREILIGHLDAIRTGRLTFGVTQGVSNTAFTGTQLVFCGFCGQKIVASDMFCPFCGAKQPMSATASPMPVFDAPKLTAKLFLVSTNDLDAPTYSLEKDSNLVGRRDPMSNIFPEVDLSKYDPQTKISRRHARIWREGDTFMVEDLGSSNGTVLISTMNDNNKLLPHTPRVLAHGDKIKVGDTLLHFVIG